MGFFMIFSRFVEKYHPTKSSAYKAHIKQITEDAHRVFLNSYMDGHLSGISLDDVPDKSDMKEGDKGMALGPEMFSDDEGRPSISIGIFLTRNCSRERRRGGGA
jgi:hypothetical protein